MLAQAQSPADLQPRPHTGRSPTNEAQVRPLPGACVSAWAQSPVQQPAPGLWPARARALAPPPELALRAGTTPRPYCCTHTATKINGYEKQPLVRACFAVRESHRRKIYEVSLAPGPRARSRMLRRYDADATVKSPNLEFSTLSIKSMMPTQLTQLSLPSHSCTRPAADGNDVFV